MSGKSWRYTSFVVFATVMLFSAAAMAETIYVELKKARVRSGPGTEYSILWEAPRYTPLELLAEYKDWYVVRDFQRDVGWIHGGSVAKGKAAIVVQEIANIRKSASLKSPIVFVAQKHYLFKVKQIKGGWVKVIDTDGEGGWIHHKLVWISK